MHNGQEPALQRIANVGLVILSLPLVAAGTWLMTLSLPHALDVDALTLVHFSSMIGYLIFAGCTFLLCGLRRDRLAKMATYVTVGTFLVHFGFIAAAAELAT